MFRVLGTTYSRTSTRAPVGPYALAVVDQVGRLVLGRRPWHLIPDLEQATIAVAKIDHLGDVMMATPFLAQLRRQLPRARVILVAGSWSRALVEVLAANALCADYILYDPWALNTGANAGRRIARNIESLRAASRRLRSLDVNCYVDLRPFSPNSLLLAQLAHMPFRVGFGLRGLSYTLDRVIPFTQRRSFGQSFLDALPLLGLEAATYEGPEPLVPVATSTDALSLPTGPYIVVQLGSRNPAREASRDCWRAILPILAERYTIVAIGGRGEAERFSWIGGDVAPERLVNLIGRTTLPQLLDIVRRSVGGVTIDSFAAHVLLSYRLPTVVLASQRHTPRASFPDSCDHLSLVDRDAPVEVVRGAVDRALTQLSDPIVARAPEPSAAAQRPAATSS